MKKAMLAILVILIASTCWAVSNYVRTATVEKKVVLGDSLYIVSYVYNPDRKIVPPEGSSPPPHYTAMITVWKVLSDSKAKLWEGKGVYVDGVCPCDSPADHVKQHLGGK